MKTSCKQILAGSFGVALFISSSLAAPPALQVIERGPNHRVVVNVTTSIAANGETIWRTNKYTELATGMHYQENGEWIESKESIDIVPGGALASQGLHRVGFAADANTLGAVNLLMTDGQRLRSHVLGLAYTDAKTGQSVLIAAVKHSIGELVGQNQIIYRDAFDAPEFKADIRYTYTKAGLEQDIVLRPGGSPTPPDAYGFDPITTRLEVFTEFLEAPAPGMSEIKLAATTDSVERKGMALPDFVDHNLSFGPMDIGSGRAFPIDSEADSLEKGVPTAKTWEHRGGRTFLIEAIQYPAVKMQLDSLAPKQGSKQAKVERKTEPNRFFPAPPLQANATKEIIRTAALAASDNGFVIDYSIISSAFSNYVFRGDTTYFVQSSAPITMVGISVLEGGAVIKLTNSTGSPQLRFAYGLDCQTSPYHPAIVTSMHDDTVGDLIVGSTGNPTNFCGYGIYLGNSIVSGYFDLHDIRISHAYHAFYGTAKINADISNCQIVHSQFALRNNTAVWNLRNVLICGANLAFDGAAPLTNSAENLTMFAVSNMVLAGLPAVNLTNSLLIGVTNGVSYNGAYVQTNLSATGVFQTVGAGAFYLATNSAYRAAGTTNITPSLLADLRRRTTFPPWAISNSITTNLTLVPVISRDTNVVAVDLGYHYDAIDYLFQNVTVTNSTLTLLNGVCVGVATNSTIGIRLDTGGRLRSDSSPLALNRLFRTSSVQEQPGARNTSGFTYLLLNTDATGTNSFRFTDFPMLAGRDAIVDTNSVGGFSFVDSQFRGGYVRSYGNIALMATNVLFDRVTLLLDTTNGPVQVGLYGCLVRGGTSTVLDSHWSGSSMEIFNTLFDSAGNVVYESSSGSTNAFNGYYNTTTLSNSVGNVVLTNLIYQLGRFGPYYQATNSALIDHGTNTAGAWGYFHYTVTTNDVKDSSRIDIGLHYVAANGSGKPVDTDGDGLPDYVEDGNGDGARDTWETAFDNTDTDYDGVTDATELLEGTDPLDASQFLTRSLATFSFPDYRLLGDQGQTPVYSNGVVCLTNANLTAAAFETNASAILCYKELRDDGSPNINLLAGRVSLWFEPDWTSQSLGGTGPGHEARLIEVGKQSTNASYGQWSICISSNGNTVTLCTQGDGSTHVVVTAAAGFFAGAMYSIIIDYSTNSSQITINGVVLSQGIGVACIPSSAVRQSEGLRIGSDETGGRQAKGKVFRVETAVNLAACPANSPVSPCSCQNGCNNPTSCPWVSGSGVRLQDPALAVGDFPGQSYGEAVTAGESVQFEMGASILGNINGWATRNYLKGGWSCPSGIGARGTWTCSTDQLTSPPFQILFDTVSYHWGIENSQLGGGTFVNRSISAPTVFRRWVTGTMNPSCNLNQFIGPDQLSPATYSVNVLSRQRLHRFSFQSDFVSDRGQDRVSSAGATVVSISRRGALNVGSASGDRVNYQGGWDLPAARGNVGSIAFWFKPSWLYGHSTATTKPATLLLQPKVALRFDAARSTLQLLVNGTVACSKTTTWQDASWHHFAMTYAWSGGVELFIDGASVATASTGYPYSFGAPTLSVGGNGTEPADGWFRLLDSYNYRLSAAEVQPLYQQSVAEFQADSDHDGILDFDEILQGTDPLDVDSDSDGVWDGSDLFPTDPTRTTIAPTPNQSDTVVPIIHLIDPHNAIPQ